MADLDSARTQAKRRRVELYSPKSNIVGSWLRWILVSTIGASAGGAAIALIGRYNLAWLLGLGVFGLLVGLAQSLVLGRVTYHTKSAQLIVPWTLVSLISWVLGGIAGAFGSLSITLLLMSTVNVDYTWIYQYGEPLFCILCIGWAATVLSYFQQRILLRATNTARRWTRTSIIGWALAWGVALGVVHLAPGSSLAKGLAGGAIGGLVLGAVTGHALVSYLAASRDENSSE